MQTPPPPNRLKELRENRGLPRHAIGSLLGRDASMIYRYEEGLTAVSDDHKRRLAKFYDVSVDFLMGWDRDEVAA